MLGRLRKVVLKNAHNLLLMSGLGCWQQLEFHREEKSSYTRQHIGIKTDFCACPVIFNVLLR